MPLQCRNQFWQSLEEGAGKRCLECGGATEDFNRRFPEITGEDNLTVFSSSGRVKSPEWRWKRRRADLRHFEIFKHGPIIIHTRLPAGTIQSARSPRSVSVWSAFLMPFLPFVYGYPSSSPRAHCTPNKSVPTLRYTRRHGPVYTGPCPKALTECSPLDFRRSSIAIVQLAANQRCQQSWCWALAARCFVSWT